MDNNGSMNLLQTICMVFLAVLSLIIGVCIGNLILGVIITLGTVILYSILSIVIIILIDRLKKNNKNEDITNK